jgi:hypothetical protein
MAAKMKLFFWVVTRRFGTLKMATVRFFEMLVYTYETTTHNDIVIGNTLAMPSRKLATFVFRRSPIMWSDLRISNFLSFPFDY